tara:strand:- start:759 stop:878 length:120 start_codon:yes stop_codon:yes gene_type:complete
MSIVICFECGKFIDTDYEEMFESKDFQMICDNCKELEEE